MAVASSTLSTATLVLAHLGSLHAYEKALIALIAFGPFVALFVVVHVVRKRDADEERSSRD